MSLTPGVSLGRYEIVGSLGAGGMGEVYRARDSRLSRDVAIKVLPQNFVADPDRRARFEREAQTIASLSHPNILAIFDTGIHDGQLFIVTELLQGETLREQVGQLPIRKSIEIGAQIARGLTAAHDKGLVHRDLKPENIFLLADGQVKILDFGLARHTNTTAIGMTGAPTAAGVTDPGIAVGTAGYMAPEQVRGAEVDHRADIFALGAVLYEMLSGRRAFQRETAAETMTAILKEDPPDLAESGLHVTPHLDRIVRRCLEKQPRMRFQSAADLGFALEAAATPTGASTAIASPDVPGPRRKFGWTAALMFFVFGFALASALVMTLSSSSTPNASAFRFIPFSFESGGQGSAVWSQDGKAVAYAAATDLVSSQQVFVRYLDSPAGLQLTHFKEYATPVGWTPDGRRIIFISYHEPAGVWSVAVVGGEPESVMPVDRNKILLSYSTLASDLSAAAMLCEEGQTSLCISVPLGAPPKKVQPRSICDTQHSEPSCPGFFAGSKTDFVIHQFWGSRTRGGVAYALSGRFLPPAAFDLSGFPDVDRYANFFVDAGQPEDCGVASHRPGICKSALSGGYDIRNIQTADQPNQFNGNAPCLTRWQPSRLHRTFG
jgi:serine/threonine protein kinase